MNMNVGGKRMSERLEGLKQRLLMHGEVLYLNRERSGEITSYEDAEDDINWLVGEVERLQGETDGRNENEKLVRYVAFMKNEIKRALQDLEAERPRTAESILLRLLVDNYGEEKILEEELKKM